MTKIAFFGLGTMGGPMARVLRQAGFGLTGMDVSADIRNSFEDAIEPS